MSLVLGQRETVLVKQQRERAWCARNRSSQGIRTRGVCGVPEGPNTPLQKSSTWAVDARNPFSRGGYEPTYFPGVLSESGVPLHLPPEGQGGRTSAQGITDSPRMLGILALTSVLQRLMSH